MTIALLRVLSLTGWGLLLLLCLILRPHVILNDREWRCAARDVETGVCDVYERRERYRDDTP
jgi:hypothetical protein